MQLYRMLYAVFVVLLASSPALSAGISGLLDTPVSLFKYIWVGVAFSLPVSLMLAKLVGPHSYVGYWSYLESFPGNSRPAVIAAWAIALAIAIAISVAS